MYSATSVNVGRGASASGNCIEIDVENTNLGKRYTLGATTHSIFLYDQIAKTTVWSIQA